MAGSLSALAGVVVAVALAGVLHALLRRALARRGLRSLGPADRITLVRAWLTCAAAGLVVVGLLAGAVTAPLVAVASVALLLDLVDGWVARRTGTATRFGARFDLEVDALLVLVLSVHVAASTTWAVVGLGLIRYAVLVTGRALPWLRGSVVPRRWRKVVAAVQGVALVVVASGLLPVAVAGVVLVVAAALLALSFGTEVLELWLLRGGRQPGEVRVPQARSVLAGVVALALGWFALAGPDRIPETRSAAMVLPLDVVVLVALVPALGPRVRKRVAGVVGVVLAVVVVLKALDLGFDWTFARPFHPTTEWSYAGSAVSLLADSVGPVLARVVVAVAVAAAVGLVVLLPWALRRLVAGVTVRRATGLRVGAALAVAWLVLAVTGLRAAPGAPVASTGAAGYAVAQVERARADLGDQAEFERGLRADPLRSRSGGELLGALRGKDVVFVFVESYGRVALDGPPVVTEPVHAALRDAGNRLGALGWSSRSAWLTSPTFGGISWLAHSTLQSGLWVDSQARYDRLLDSPRGTLARAFREAGWRTVADVPSNVEPWPEGARFYGWDRLYGAGDVGYAGPRLGYARVPDQFTLHAFAERELGAGHPPVMAEVDLVSSHVPWAPLPRLLDPDELCDGSVYARARGRDGTREATWADRDGVRAAYGRSVAYALASLTRFLEAEGDDDLVLVVLGDHQPSAVVTGRGASHEVPVTILARDPDVTARAAALGWVPGLRPRAEAPVWRMDAFRDRFLAAYSGEPEH